MNHYNYTVTIKNKVTKGICKECLEPFELNTQSQLFIDNIPSNIWECPNCDYPNNISDFWNIYKIHKATGIIIK